MLDEARAAGHYDKLEQGSLDEPLPHPPNSVDILSCIGTLSYIRADGPCMSEWCRVVRSGGLIVFTHRGPYDTEPPYYEEAGWKAAQEGLETIVPNEWCHFAQAIMLLREREQKRKEEKGPHPNAHRREADDRRARSSAPWRPQSDPKL